MGAEELALVTPQEGSHGEVSLLMDITGDGQSIFVEQAVELPLGHGLVVGSGVPRVVQWHLELPTPF